MLAAATVICGLVFVVWFWLMYRFHCTLKQIDPELSREIGEPSIFWTAFNGHAHLVNLMRRKDLPESRYAPLAGQARLLRIWAVALIAAMLWTSWVYWRTPGV